MVVSSSMAQQQQQQRQKGDALYREASKLVTPPTSRLARLTWKRDPATAAGKFVGAGHAFAAAGATALAIDSLQKGAEAHLAAETPFQAAHALERAAALAASDGNFASVRSLSQQASDAWVLAGHRGNAVEALARGAAKCSPPTAEDAPSDDDALALWRLTLDAAAEAETRGVDEAAAKAWLWLVGADHLDVAAESVPTVVKALDGADVDDDHPTRLRLLAASIVLELARRDVHAADKAFFAALDGCAAFAASRAAAVAEDLLAAVKRGDREAFEMASKPQRLADLDVQLAQLVTRPGGGIASLLDEAEVTPQNKAPPPPEVEADAGRVDDDDDLPDLS